MVVHNQEERLISSLQIEDTEVQIQALTAINKHVKKYDIRKADGIKYRICKMHHYVCQDSRLLSFLLVTLASTKLVV